MPPGRPSPFVIAIAIVAFIIVSGSYYQNNTTARVPAGPFGRSKATVTTRLPADYYKQPVAEFFSSWIDEWFAPWDCLAADESEGDVAQDASSMCQRPITAAAISGLEWSVQGNSYRIRYSGEHIFYRPLQTSTQTYQVQRANWTMTLLQEMHDEGLLVTTTSSGDKVPIRFDSVFHWSDTPAIVKDNLGPNAGYLLFSMFSSQLHLDIPMPDPPAYGSNGNYVWPTRDKLVPWEDKEPRLVFRGQVSYKFGVDNWQTNPRIRLAQLGQRFPELMDVGNTAYRVKPLPPLLADGAVPLDPKNRTSIFGAASVQRVTSSSNVTVAKKMSFYEQSKFKFILDIDGGLASSRVMATLGSGSVPFLVESGWHGNFQQALVPWVHYIPVTERLTDLVPKIRWARDNEYHARRIVDNAIKFAEAYVSRQAAKEQLAAMLERYSRLLAKDVRTDDSDAEYDYCVLPETRAQMLAGPLGCSRRWVLWNGTRKN